MRISYYFRPVVIFSILWVLYIYFSTDLLIKKIPIDKSIICGSVRSYPSKGFNSYYFYLKVNDQTIVVLSNDKPNISLYEVVCVDGDVEEISSNQYFGNFSWKKYMNMKNIFWQIKSKFIKKVGDSPIIFSFVAKIRYSFISFIEKNFKRDTATIVLGLVLGEKAELPKYLKDAMNRCGILHLMVASGSNISYFTGIIVLILSFFGIKRSNAFLVSILLDLVYVIMIGFDPPITRAYIMLVFGYIFYFIKKNIDPLQILFTVFLIVSFINPLYIYDPSFIMSFLCVYGIIVGFINWGFLVKIMKPFNISPQNTKSIIFIKKIVNALVLMSFPIFLMTIFSQIGISVYTLTHFYRFSIISIVSNIIFVPFSSVIITSSLIWLILSFFIKGSLIVGILEYMVEIFIKLIYFFSSFKYSIFYFSPYSLVNEIGIVILLLFILHLPSINFLNPLWRSVGFMIIFIFFVSFFWKDSIKEDIVLKTGEKDIWFIERNSFYYLIDPVIDADKIINAVYASRRNKIDYILISSYSSYRIKTIKRLNDIFNIKKIYIPLWLCDNELKNSSCIFGGEKGFGFLTEFRDKYGYFNVYSSIRFCFGDRCF